LRFAGNFKLVRPRGFVNVTCDTEAWRSLDFRARIDELAVEVAVLKARFPGSKLFLVGHSAGAHVAILYTADHAGDIAGIVNLGGGLQELRLVLLDIAAGRARTGRATDTDTALAEARELVSGVEARGPDDAAPFWNRTYRFWYQMFFSGVQALWSHPAVPVLIIHGGRDLDSVPFEQVQIQARSNEGNGMQFHAFADKGHDLLDAEVFRAVDEWIHAKDAPPR
jgi:pimeloyl-ACP methyl ester carboxylesterase